MSEIPRVKVSCIPIDESSKVREGNFDSLVIVSSDITAQTVGEKSYLHDFINILKQYKEWDASFNENITFLVPDVKQLGKIKKLIYSPVGPLDRHYDDVRRFGEATEKGVKRALQAGAKSILLAVVDNSISKDLLQRYDLFDEVTLLAALHALYVPLEIREGVPAKSVKVEHLGFSSLTKNYNFAMGIEDGRIVARDIGGSDPERMTAINAADYVQKLFPQGSSVKIQVIEDEQILQKEYPLLNAVNRATRGVDRHRARLVLLTYDSSDQPSKTLFLVGKGITYDTGGADIKSGGVMAGMHRDKCGAAAVAGFFETLDQLKPRNIKVVGALCLVRNSVGSEAYVSDEIITSRAGVRVRVGNTDAEGRMVMADVLCHMKELALGAVNPYIFTIATLTGHAVIAVGDGYSIIADNGPAEVEGVGINIQKAGHKIGDMFERSTIRREDYQFCKGPSEYEDLLQCNNAPSSRTPRGHQFPAAFMIQAAGLDKHDINSSSPLKYSHIDIAASSGPFPGVPTGAPIPALAYYFLS